jgi:hypothetical protein
MPTLLVDDRDGRVIAEVESQEEALRLLATFESADVDLAACLCVVELHGRQGAIVGTESSFTLRSL